jgi:hypothetical protein
LAVRDQAVQRGADAADEGAGNDRCFAPPGVGKRSKCKGADDRADATAVEDRRRLAVGQMPGRPNHGEQERDDPEIEEFEHDDRRHDYENRPIARVELGGVEQRQKLVGRPTGHILLPSKRLGGNDRPV